MITGIERNTPEGEIEAERLRRMVDNAIEACDTPLDGGFGYDFGVRDITRGISYAGEIPAAPAKVETAESPTYNHPA